MLCRRQLLVASFLLLASAVGCNGDDPEQAAAEGVLKHYFNALKNRSFDAALLDYDKSFFTGVTRSEWRSALSSVVDTLGTFRSYDVMSSGIAYKQTAGPGSYYRFLLEVTYSKHRSTETLYVVRKEGSSSFKIVGHQIDSDALKK